MIKEIAIKISHVKKSYIVYAILVVSVTTNILTFVSLNEKGKKFDDGSDTNLERIFPEELQINPGHRQQLPNEIALMEENDPRKRKRFQSLDEKLAKYNLAGNNKINAKNVHSIAIRPAVDDSKTANTDRKEKVGKLVRVTPSPPSTVPLFRVVTDSSNFFFDNIRNVFSGFRYNDNVNTTDNEELRKKFFIVLSQSRNTQNYIWFHKKVDRKNHKNVSQEDGILEQMNYVPKSYASKLKTLKLTGRLEKTTGSMQQYFDIKLDDYLKSEFNKTVQRIISKKDASSIVWQGLKKSAVPIYNSKLPSVKNKPDWNSLLKFIFTYDIPSDVGLGREAFIMSKCPVSSCYITNNPMLRRVSHIFFLQDTMQAPVRKPKGQIWLSRILESPINSFVPSGIKTYLNWTATYRWDSTIVTPYAKFVSNSDIKKYSRVLDESVSNASSSRTRTRNKKTHLAAWFASNCMTDNDRYGYVQELKRYIPIDVYGQCGDMQCSRYDEKSCFQILSDKYKFYLSFENSNCDYYITEKFFLNALSNNIVPVVMGARKQDYLKSAPPNSFISVEDFPDAKSLANYLIYLDGNEEMYNRYLAWKGSGQFVNTKFWCRVCALVQDDDRPSMWYENFSDWWSHPGACRQGRWKGK